MRRLLIFFIFLGAGLIFSSCQSDPIVTTPDFELTPINIPMPVPVDMALRETIPDSKVVPKPDTSSVNTYENARKYAGLRAIDAKRVETDASIKKDLKLYAINEGTTKDGLYRVQFVFQNQHYNTKNMTQTLSIRYKITWYDSQGFEVNKNQARGCEKTLLPGNDFELDSIAPNRNCKDFKLRLIRQQ